MCFGEVCPDHDNLVAVVGSFCQGLTLQVGRSMLNMATRIQPVKKTKSSSQPQESGETETTSKAIMKLLLEQQKMQQEQQ